MSEKTVDIPEGIEVKQEGNVLTVKGPKGELTRDFSHPKIVTEAKEKKVTFRGDDEKRKTYALLGTFASHVRNMVTGVTKGWEARIKAVYSHFPVKVAVQGDTVAIQNFLGERSTREAKIVGDTVVNAKKDDIIITGTSKEDVGQTAANIELIAKVKGFDRRIFQDGFYVTQKCQPAGE
ncbi:MAG: 50S ribosomal protein L6 [Candidatus Aenigmatarchaeota archaeon]|nr:MAG: 50S ribosomal protein L6 [Candidatus Aenigmarchaeota archaeon]